MKLPETLAAAEWLPWLPAIVTLFGGLFLRWFTIHRLLPPLVAPLGEIGERYRRRTALVSLILVATATTHFLLSGYGLDDVPLDDLIILACLSYLIVEAIRSVVVDHYWIRVRGHQVPRLIVNVGEAIVYLSLMLSLSSTLFDLNLTPVLATSAVLSAVIGLALQDTLGSLFAGLALHADQPYKPGDWVLICGYEGQVVELSWRSTKLRTRRNELVVLPNNKAAQSELLNYSQPTIPVERNVTVRFGYDLAPDLLKERTTAMLADVPGVLADPPPDLRLLAFGEVGIEYQVVYWITDFLADMRIAADVRRRLWYLSQRHGTPIPLPVRHVYLQSRPADRDLTAEALQAFAGVDFLLELPAEALTKLAQQATLSQWGTQEVIVHEGDRDEDLYILRHGRVRVDVRAAAGEPVTVGTLGAGEFFGEMSLLTGEPRTATIVTEAPTELIRVSKRDLEPVLHQHGHLMERISQVLAERTAARQDKISTVTGVADGEPAAKDVTERQQRLLGRIRSFFHRPT